MKLSLLPHPLAFALLYPYVLVCAWTALPSWKELEIQYLSGGDTTTDSSQSDFLPRLFREKQGWCVYSTRLWLALEVKHVRHDTVLEESVGDTFDGSLADRVQPLPYLQLSNSTEKLCGATESSSIELILNLDSIFPDHMPLLVPPAQQNSIRVMTQVYQNATRKLNARQSPRAGWLFCNEEGFRLDPLPRESFEEFLSTADGLLLDDGPFFGGSTNITAADIVWAPLLERYVAQLPCLHAGLNPRQWPKLERWYQAMSTVPVYACRIRGDAPSWRKVLYREPWWPASDLWHPRDTVGPKGELLLDEEDCKTIYGGVKVPLSVWDAYAMERPDVGRTPYIQAALQLIRNHKAIGMDAQAWMLEQGYDDDLHTLDSSLRTVTCAFLVEGGDEHSFEIDRDAIRNELLLYLDDRVCVPRDMGAPVALCIREWRSKIA